MAKVHSACGPIEGIPEFRTWMCYPTNSDYTPVRGIYLDIHLPIVPKARPRVTSDGTFMPKEYTENKTALSLIMGSRVSTYPDWNRKASFALDVDVMLHMSTQGDADSIAGTIMDAGTGIFWDDDRQVVDVRVRKIMIPKERDRAVSLQIVELTDTGFEPKKKSEAAAKRKARARAMVAADAHPSAMTVEEYLAYWKTIKKAPKKSKR